jgi:hypothetical protein
VDLVDQCLLFLARGVVWCGVVLLPWDDEREDWIGEGAEQSRRLVGWVRALGGVDGHGFYRRRALVGWLVVAATTAQQRQQAATRREERA